ncbi:MAG: dienelactone hydrolase family protein, partial [Synechococcus sp.]
MTIGCVSSNSVTIRTVSPGSWVSIESNDLALRCWWSASGATPCDIELISCIKRVYIVLPEVFGLNAWVRSVADRLAAHGTAALAMPLFARSAPDLDLGYKESDLAQGRRHKDATTTSQILSDLSVAITWLKHRCPKAAIDVVGFCFGGHAALLAATLPEVRRSFDFYGAGVSTMRPGGGPPSLELLPQVSGELNCICGTADSLIPADHRFAIRDALQALDPDGERLRY